MSRSVARRLAMPTSVGNSFMLALAVLLAGYAIVGIALFVGLIAGIVIAVVLDRLDKPLPSGKMARAGRGQAGDNATASARPPTNGAEVAACGAAVHQSE
jgi:hypothetical protein